MLSLSIIVPVYNVANYLSKCLESLLIQNINPNEYEIIVINDGSTDDSLIIAKEFSKKFQNIRIISQVNQGLGEARNTGIKSATGKYLMFVDSDDYIEPNCLASLLNRIELQDLDLLRFNHQEVDMNYEIIPKTKNATYAVVYKEDVINGKDFLANRLGWACYACSYLFKSSFLIDNELFYKKRIYYEDVEWLPRVLLQANRVSSLNMHVYNYMRRIGSITMANNLEEKKKILDDKLLMIDYLLDMSKIANEENVLKWFNGAMASTVVEILKYTTRHLPEYKKEVMSILKAKRIFPIKPYKFTPKQKRDVSLVNLSPSFYCFLCGSLHGISTNYIKNYTS